MCVLYSTAVSTLEKGSCLSISKSISFESELLAIMLFELGLVGFGLAWLGLAWLAVNMFNDGWVQLSVVQEGKPKFIRQFILRDPIHVAYKLQTWSSKPCVSVPDFFLFLPPTYLFCTVCHILSCMYLLFTIPIEDIPCISYTLRITYTSAQPHMLFRLHYRLQICFSAAGSYDISFS